MQTPEEFAAMLDRCAHAAEGMGERLTDTYRVADLIRERDAEVRADELAKVLAGFTEWFAPGFTYPNGRTVPIGEKTVVREFAAADARDMASPEDATPTLVVRRLVGPWEPTP